jgi:hypothetical protein
MQFVRVAESARLSIGWVVDVGLISRIISLKKRKSRRAGCLVGI